MSTNPWNHVAEASEIKNASGRDAGCSDVMNDTINNAFSNYVSNDVNFGSDSFETRVAEQDAFTAGWNAAIAFIAGINED